MADFSLRILADVSAAKKGVEDLGKSVSLLTKFIGVDLAIKGFGALADALKAPIAEAENAAKEMESLNLALALSGQYSEETAKQFEDLASSLETTSIFSGEAVLSASKLALNLGATADQAKTLVKAASDLAAATGTDLNTATEALTKSLQGQGRQLAQLVPQTKGLTEEALRSGAALGFVADRFKGAAEAAGNTFSGALTQNKEAFNNLLESIGNFIVKNPVVIFLIKEATRILGIFTRYIEENKDSIMSMVQNGIVFAIKGLSGLVSILRNYVIPAFQTWIEIQKTTFNILVELSRFIGVVLDPVINRLGAGISYTVAILADFLKVLLKIPGAGDALGLLGVDAESLSKSLDNASASLKETGDSFDIGKIRDDFQSFGNSVLTTTQETAGAVGDFLGGVEGGLDGLATNAEKLVGKSLESAATAIKGSAPIPVPIDTEKLKKDIQAAYQTALNNPVEGILNLSGVKINKEFTSEAQAGLAGIVQGLGKSVTAGAEGARQAVSGALTAGATAVLGPFGQALGPLLDAFTKGPDAVKQMIKDFIGAIPMIIQNIILAIPAFIIAILDAIPVLIDGILEAIPVVIEELNAALPIIIEKVNELMPLVIQAVIDNLPALISALISNFPFIATQLSLALAAQAPFIALSFSTALIAQIPKIVESIAAGVKDAIGKITGGLGGGGGGGIVGGITGAIGGVAKKLKFADGGVIPGGFPNDSFGPAFLSSGEGIVPTDTMSKLDNFLSKAGGGGGGTSVIKLVVGEQELANVILNLNRQGFRVNG